jgi:hypothetical protein
MSNSERSCWNCKYNSRKFTKREHLDKFYCYRLKTKMKSLDPCGWWEYGAIEEE